MAAEDYPTTITDEEIAEQKLFWSEIICFKDGTISEANLYAELFDFFRIMNSASIVYDHVTCGRVSKPNTHHADVISVADECLENQINDAVLEVLDRITDGEAVADLVKEFENDD